MPLCNHCGHNNAPGAIACEACGRPFITPEAADTSRLEPIADITSAPRWGTARLGDDRKLNLQVHGYSRSLSVCVKDRLILGRIDQGGLIQPDILLDEFNALEQGVSRHHAVIYLEDNVLKVMDLDSVNGTYLNGLRLIPHQCRILRDGDELRLGNLRLRASFA